MTTLKEHYTEQHGDYVIGLEHPRSPWFVRIAGYGPSKYGVAEYLSTHNSKREALTQMKRYQAADKRRR